MRVPLGRGFGQACELKVRRPNDRITGNEGGFSAPQPSIEPFRRTVTLKELCEVVGYSPSYPRSKVSTVSLNSRENSLFSWFMAA